MNGIVVGSVRVVLQDDGNVHIDITHTPENGVSVERADVPDLIKGLVAMLGPDFIYEHGHVMVMSEPYEMIAAYVAGDGTDPQRLALADGIRTERYAKGLSE